MPDSIAIIGAGVSGLTCGVALQKEGFETKIITEEVSPNTTSDISAALWYPYKAEPIHKVLKWGAVSIDQFLALSEQKDTGVRITPALELLDEENPDPWWKDIVLNFRMAAKDEIPADYDAAYYFEAPLIEMPIYMKYLAKQYQQLGGTIKKLEEPLQSLNPVLKKYELVINCTGLGSRKLVGDSRLFPIRGQVVVIKNTEDLNRCLIDLKAKRALTYIIPRQNDCVLGGSSEDHQWEEALSATTRETILNHCQEIIPKLSNPEIVTEKIGLRPAREGGIRLEIEQKNDHLLIHNYGHGGAGVTLSWGCAREVLSLAKKSLP